MCIMGRHETMARATAKLAASVEAVSKLDPSVEWLLVIRRLTVTDLFSCCWHSQGQDAMFRMSITSEVA